MVDGEANLPAEDAPFHQPLTLDHQPNMADPMGLAPTTLPQTTGRSAVLSYGSEMARLRPDELRRGSLLPDAVVRGLARRAAARHEVEGEGWWEVLVTLQSSLPARFDDTRVTAGQPDHFPDVGCGGGGRTHEGRAYEAHLNLILPAVKLVESAGFAPAWACLQGRARRSEECRVMSGESRVTLSPLSTRNSLLYTSKSGKPSGCRPRRADSCRLRRTLVPGLSGHGCGCRESHPDLLPGKKTFCC